MKHSIRFLTALSLCLAILLCLPIAEVRAEETVEAPAQELLAEDISSMEVLTDSYGIPYPSSMFDGVVKWGLNTKGQDAGFTLSHEGGIGSLYFIYDCPTGTYTVTNGDTGAEYLAGELGYMHAFLDLEAIFGQAPTTVTVTYSGWEVMINELYVFTPGQVPDFVQKWETPTEDGMDMILFSTHGDDEQLFFAGLLPYYAAELDYEVLVVYLTNH